MDYDEFVANVLSDEPATQPKAEKKRTAEDIMADFAPIVAADKRKGGYYGNSARYNQPISAAPTVPYPNYRASAPYCG